jgi:hypothetical protein
LFNVHFLFGLLAPYSWHARYLAAQAGTLFLHFVLAFGFHITFFSACLLAPYWWPPASTPPAFCKRNDMKRYV